MTKAPMIFICNTTYLMVDDYNHMAQHFLAQGHPVIICTPETPTPEQRARLTDEVLHEPMPIDRSAGGSRGLWTVLQHGRALARRYPDGIFTLITAQAHILYGLPLRWAGRRIVFLMAGMGTLFSSQQRRHKLLRPWVKRLYRHLYGGRQVRVMTQNREDQAYVRAQLGARDPIFMPGCGADPQDFPYSEPPQTRPKVILVPARIIVEKGIWEAAEASSILAERGVDHQLWFSSDIDHGNPMALTRADVDSLTRRNPHIRFLGFQKEMGPVFRGCHVVCLPSYREGLPTALIEASAVGRAIVATRVHGCREIIEDGCNGLLVPPRDAAALADALERVLRDDALMERLRQEAYRRFQSSYTREASLRATLPAYEGPFDSA